MRLTFLGAARIVTGSSYLLEVAERKVLIDCGMFQGSKAVRSLNYRPFPYSPAEIDCVLLTHAHIDHSGLIPRLCKDGFKGKIHATKVTAELCGIMLPDSGHIQEFDAEIANRKGQRAGKKPVEVLYTVEDAYACLKQFAYVDYNTDLFLSPEIRVRYREAGHILGSSLLEVWVTENQKTVKIVFSGDLGQPDQPIIKDPVYITEADYVLTETTYGNRLHETYDKEEALAAVVNSTFNRGGNVIIPSFAVGRTQTLLYYLHKLFKAKRIPDIPVIIDSPLAISATDVFMKNVQEYDSEAYDLLFKEHDDPLHMPQLTFTKTAEESKALNNMEQPAIIISASGMADAGRILHHLKHNLWRPESSVLFVGYQAQESLGRRLIEGVKRVKILGEEISVRAEIHNMDGFSAHADRSQLLDWLEHFTGKPANIFLVHGESDMSEPFAKLVEERLGVSTYIPSYGETAVLDGRQWQMEPSTLAGMDPAVKQLQDSLLVIEAELAEYRKKLEQLVLTDTAKAKEAMNQFKKLSGDLKKVISGQ